MFRDHRVPAGPRPAAASSHSPTRLRAKENISPINAASRTQSMRDGPMLHASSSNNHSLFSFGRNGGDDVDETTTGSLDFLPSISFDDLQNSLQDSLQSISTDFKLTQFPSPTGQGSILGDKPLVDKMAGQQSNVTHHGNTTRVAIQQNPNSNATAPATRSSRSGSVVRRSTAANRQSSIGSTVSASSSSVIDAPTGPAASRARRQSHYPPVSNSTIVKPPRKSIGPGIIDADYGTRFNQNRRPSLRSNASEQEPSKRLSTEIIDRNNGTPSGENTRSFAATTRAAKAKSVQPIPRLSSNFSASTSSSRLTPDGNRKSALFPRSPRAGAGTNHGSNKRMSVMPGMHTSHPTGLGARTISPTDAQRMKRMSMFQSQNLSQVVHGPPPTLDTRPASRSPSMIPRKTSTPASSRTTPDVSNRKSYNSILSVSSTTSFDVNRTSTGSMQRGIGQSASTSRLPAPKALNVHTNVPATEEDSDVPPVPAIPKVYGSPKDSTTELSFLDKRKSMHTLDSSSVNSSSTGNLSNAPSLEPAAKLERRGSKRKMRSTLVGLPAETDKNATPVHIHPKKHLAPLRLPPLNLGPLSTPTTAKIASLRDHPQDDGRISPTPSRVVAKTPTTPLTASRSTFFTRGRVDRDPEKPRRIRSKSLHHSPVDTSSGLDATSSEESLMDSLSDRHGQKASISPFLSSSVPKDENDFGAQIARAKTSGELNKTLPVDFIGDSRPQRKPTGPRAQKLTKPANKMKSPPPVSSPEAPTPSSIGSLRRKLSLSWKRSGSKSGHHTAHGSHGSHASHGSIDQTSAHHAQQDSRSMPPPRLPISATVGSVKAPSPSHASKPSGSYLESRRRKSSASSLNTIMAHEKAHNEARASPKRSMDVGNSSMIETSTSRPSGPAQRLLRPRPSVAAIQGHSPYVAEMDKDDLIAEEEMKKLALRKKETEMAARTLDALRKRATPKERVGPQEAIRIAMLNIYERGEIVDYNDVYFCGTQNAAKVVGNMNSSEPNFGYDDDRGDYTIVVGDHLAYRYEIVDVLGKGSFGQVVRCIDHKTGVLVAVKIIRNKKRFHQQALVEVNILQKLREWDPKNKHSMVNFTHSFYFRGHLCISTELLDMNLYEFIKSNHFRGFSLKLIRRFTKQMLSSLNLLKQHKVIHCDLKPENILLRHPMHSEIKVIDFGSSCFEKEKVYTYIQSRFYRSPEVILGMNYGLPIDMWSLGCILAELHTGVPIFPGENEQEQLACIMEVFGPPEKHLIEKSTRKKLFFDSMGKPRLTVSSKGRRRRPSSKTLQQALKCDDEAFLDFIARCLRWDPDRRIKPEEAIRHEFVTGIKTAVPVPRNRESSPMKRHNTISTARPLPEPPAAAKGGVPLRNGASPHKAFPVGPRRASAFTGPFTSGGMKRASAGQAGFGVGGGSNLPRVAGRSVSAKQDLASAGANVAMSRRA